MDLFEPTRTWADPEMAPLTITIPAEVPETAASSSDSEVTVVVVPPAPPLVLERMLINTQGDLGRSYTYPPFCVQYPMSQASLAEALLERVSTGLAVASDAKKAREAAVMNFMVVRMLETPDMVRYRRLYDL